MTGPAPPDDEDDGMRRRRDRNTREQQRSQKISTQIDVLRDVLKEANVGFKSDKHSTLVSVTEYIRTLQNRKALLDEEHARLLTTIRRTSDAVLSGGAQAQAPPSSQLCPPPGGAEVSPPAPYGGPDAVPSAAPLGSGSESGGGGMGMAMGTGVAASASLPAHPSSSAGAGAGGMPPSADEELLHFVRGLDYRSIFSSCGIAMAIAAVDGRLVDCNEELVALTGRTRRELVGEADGSGRKMSLFNLVGRRGMESVFGAMSRMLKVDPGPLPPRGGAAGGGQHTAPKAAAAGPERSSDHWSGIVEQQGTRAGRRLRLNMSLVRSGEGRPKFFNCALAPDEEKEEERVSGGEGGGGGRL